MKENAFQIQSALDGNYLSVALEHQEQMDEIAIKMLKEDCPDFLIPFQMVMMNDRITLKYKLQDAVSLAYTSMTFTKKGFIDFYTALLRPFEEVSDWFMDYHYLCIDKNYVYLNRDMSKASFLYIPEYSYRNTDEEIVNFFREILNQVTITDDNGILLKLYQYFSKNGVVFSELRELLKSDAGKAGEVPKSVSQPQYKVPPRRKEVIEKKVSEVAENEAKQGSSAGNRNSLLQNDEDDVMDALFGEKNKKKEKKQKLEKTKSENQKADRRLFANGLFGKKKKIARVEEKQEREEEVLYLKNQEQKQIETEETEIVIESGGETDATVIVESDIQSGGYLELKEAANQMAIQCISLDFTGTHITIGRQSDDVVQPDIAFDRSFKQISRMHLRIEKKENIYSVIDLGSVNHTFLNGEKLIPNVPYELKSGMELTLASKPPIRYRVVL